MNYPLNTQICLKAYPENVPMAEHFYERQVEQKALSDGQVRCQTLYLSLDPYMRSQIAGRHLTAPIKPDDMMMGETVSRIIESNSIEYKEGQIVRCMGGWQSYSVHDEKAILGNVSLDHPSHALSVLGMPGLTAYAGLMWQAQPKAGDVVVIPAATGGVGATAGQLAKLAGCTVVGIAGSDEKCQYAINELGYDFCINRKTEDVAQKLDQYCPNGIDIYFDLVGGETLHLASERLAIGARVILCGLVAEYNNTERMAGPAPALWIKSRATVFGLVVYDFESKRNEFIEACTPLVNNGQLKMKEDISHGLSQAPIAFSRLMQGQNMGKTLVKVA